MRYKKTKAIREKLKKKKSTIGTWQQIPHGSISEILGKAGYDWVAVDLEHGSIDVSQLPDLFRAIELGESLPLARVADGNSKEIKQALDAGAGGVIVPMIESAEQLALISDFCRWPPSGTRGVGFSRANLFGSNFNAYKEESQSPLLIAQIEHVNAINNLDEILSVPGLDAIMVGPYDLSASMNIAGQFEHSNFKDILKKILSLGEIKNVPTGIHVIDPDPEQLKKVKEEGYQFIAYSIDAVFLSKNVVLNFESLK
tara:strand:- start:26683 stop:27450 length:768 start_codon:yes stop_codon:yes gene_type:complete